MLSPTVKHTIKPGPAVAAIPSISLKEILLSIDEEFKKEKIYRF